VQAHGKLPARDRIPEVRGIGTMMNLGSRCDCPESRGYVRAPPQISRHSDL